MNRAHPIPHYTHWGFQLRVDPIFTLKMMTSYVSDQSLRELNSGS